MQHLIILGPPGAGKGTQSQRLEDRHGFKQLATGDMMRAEMAAETELGATIKSYYDAGLLVPDGITLELLNVNMQRNTDAEGFIYDGFPRTENQAVALGNMLEEKGESIHCVIQLVVDEDKLLERIENRAQEALAIGEQPRKDDDPEVFKKRLGAYHEQTAALIPFYKEKGLLKEVDGMQSIENVTQDIETILGLSSAQEASVS